MSTNQELFSPKYSTLRERGVMLEDEQLDGIVRQIDLGIDDVKLFLNIREDKWGRIISSENGVCPGYVPDDRQSINLPIAFLNNLKEVDLEKDTMQLWDIPETGAKLTMTWARFLRIMAREETIHHYQHVGHSRLTASIDSYASPELDKVPINYHLEPHEVEARKIVDEICESMNEPLVWRVYDAYLSNKRMRSHS